MFLPRFLFNSVRPCLAYSVFTLHKSTLQEIIIYSAVSLNLLPCDYDLFTWSTTVSLMCPLYTHLPPSVTLFYCLITPEVALTV